MTGVKKLAAQAAELTGSEADRVTEQLQGILDDLAADESSYADKRLRHGLEMFLAGYRARAGSR
ncbi:hypothetical protein [Arthrobacter bambusae]|uniref:hypothetical protein n=1 Tax=Arthrobacter bambusae TaxID=1338426 RepID=UPI00277DDF07|nr:hypothetical protein [Arthrobacter bambusae]MDQ0212646.1 hypothetical protein [Arthrobacter bambusae]